jgi:hypothetical protein
MGQISSWSVLMTDLLRDNVGTTKKDTESITDPSKELGLEVNAEYTK